MAPKKKKGLQKPQRGFATVSIPKKVAAEDAAAPEPATAPQPSVVPPASSNGHVAARSREPSAPPEQNSSAGQANAVDSWEDDSERTRLQQLVEPVRSAAEKESARTLKTIEFERRLAKSYSRFELDSKDERDLAGRVLALAREEDSSAAITAAEADVRALQRVATLDSILTQLGFSRERIQECMLAARSLEQRDVFDWLFVHADEDELACAGQAASQPTTNGTSTPAPQSEPPSQAPSEPPSAPASEPPSTSASAAPSEDESSSSEDEDEEPNERYARLKLAHSELQRDLGKRRRAAAKAKTGEDATIKKMSLKAERLEKRIASVERDYLFGKQVAERLFRERRAKLDAQQLAARLNRPPSPPPPPAPVAESPERPEESAEPAEPAAGAVEPQPATTNADVEGNDSDEDQSALFGEMFGEAGEAANGDATEDTTIAVRRDMALPRHFSGKTPRSLLEDAARKLDRYAHCSFTVISRSRAVRAKLAIRWDTSKGPPSSLTRVRTEGSTTTFEMTDVACEDAAQAYNFVATLALFEVAGGPKSQSVKQLPGAYRELWDELTVERQAQVDGEYRERIRGWQEILEKRGDSQPVEKKTPVKKRNEQDSVSTPSSSSTAPRPTPEALQQILADKQSTPSYAKMRTQRDDLPIAAYRKKIMGTIEDAQCMVLCGETGCGKSTQVPSFLLEHELAAGRPVKVFCAEPRRISAISLAQRVSAELGEHPGACGTRASLVGYSVRLDSHIHPSTRLVYATTGTVLRMFEGEGALADATHIIIDEVHERSIESDFLLILLREILQARPYLKVILMSATVDAEKLAAYMGGCPVVQVPGRTFPVTSYFLEDAIELTGYNLDSKSDSPYVNRRQRRPRAVEDAPPSLDDDDEAADGAGYFNANYSKATRTTLESMDQIAINFDLIVRLLEDLCVNREDLRRFSAATLVFMPSLESIRRLVDTLEGHPLFGSREFRVLPLHSSVSNEDQAAVFNRPPPGVRKIVVSTNLAETGVTIPDITCVIDSGKHREMRYDEKRQISRLVETFVARSNAAQRRGRAGRVQEGVCFHLFTKHRCENTMAEHPLPEMLRLSLQDLALRIKILNIGDSIENVLSKALDPPAAVNVQRAVGVLIEAKALTTTEEITPLGRHLAKLPMDVHLGKFLILSCLFSCLDAALTITAALNSKSPFVTPFGKESEAESVKRSWKLDDSDFLTVYNAYCAWRNSCITGTDREFVRRNFLGFANLQMIEELKQQYFGFLVDIGFLTLDDRQRREHLSWRPGRSRQRFVRVPAELDGNSCDGKIVTACLASALYPKLLIVDQDVQALRTLSNNAPASIHPSSVNFTPGRKSDALKQTKYLVYGSAMLTKKLYIWDSAFVDERAVLLMCGSADFQLPAHSLTLDGKKIRARLDSAKSAVALRLLRHQYGQLFDAKMRRPSMDWTQRQQAWFTLVMDAIMDLAKRKEDKEREERDLAPKMGRISLHRPS